MRQKDTMCHDRYDSHDSDGHFKGSGEAKRTRARAHGNGMLESSSGDGGLRVRWRGEGPREGGREGERKKANKISA